MNMIMGVILFSLVSTAITQIINNFDYIDAYEEEQLSVINKIYFKYDLPQDLYSELIKDVKDKIVNFDDDIKDYCLQLPINLKNKLTQVLYERVYIDMYFLQGKPN
jgi:hypothetical protein